MDSRVLVPEKMDDPQLDCAVHHEALRGLQRINRWTGNAQVAWKPIRRLALALGTDRLSVLDVATGGGDVPLDLWRLAKRSSIELQFEACDISDQALEFARQHFRASQFEAKLFPFDILEDDLESRYDVVMCTTFLHHLTDEQAVDALRRMGRAARHCVIVVDLVRSQLNYWQVWLACHTLSRSHIVRFDGPQSIRAAYTSGEVAGLAKRAGLQAVEIRHAWPCRFVLVGRPEQ